MSIKEITTSELVRELKNRKEISTITVDSEETCCISTGSRGSNHKGPKTILVVDHLHDKEEKRIDQLEKKVAELEGQVQEQPNGEKKLKKNCFHTIDLPLVSGDIIAVLYKHEVEIYFLEQLFDYVKSEVFVNTRVAKLPPID